MLEIIRRNKKATRAQIAKETGLSTQSLTRLTKQLMQLDLISEHSRVEGHRGQPAIYLTITEKRFCCVGVVFEHDRITVVLDDFNCKNILKFTEHGTFLSAARATKLAQDMLEKLFATIEDSITVLGIGVSISGFFMNIEGQICSQQDPVGWSQINFQAMFAERFNCPCFVENDGNAASIGFSQTQEGATFQSFFLLLFTLDVGGGFVFNGQLVDGAYGNAGEIAALFNSNASMPRPTIGSLQQYYSDAAAQPTDYGDIEKAIAKGDPIIESWTMSCVESMKYPLKAIQSLLDPEAIIFAGRLPDALQKKLSENIHIAAPSFGGLTAPKPTIYVSGGSNILELGVTSIPAFYFFNR
nr:ROK family transcriptional regulator [Alteromonas pelagimontana]